MLPKKRYIREYDFRWRRISEIDCVLGLLPQYVQCSITVNSWSRIVTIPGKSGKIKEFENGPEKSENLKTNQKIREFYKIH